MTTATVPSKPRIRWMCRRGMKELDVILEKFFAADFDSLNDTEVAAFVALLELEDPDLNAVMLGKQPPATTDIAHVLERIRSHAGY